MEELVVSGLPAQPYPVLGLLSGRAAASSGEEETPHLSLIWPKPNPSGF